MKTNIHTYKFDITDPKERKKYEEVCQRLKDRHRMKCIPMPGSTYPEEGEIELDTEHLFANQWNTICGFRVFDWYEAVLNNDNIKQGHYLDITEEMKEIRRNTNACGFCGHQEPAQKGNVFCTQCLDSPYLKENELHLLRMLPVEQYMPKRNELTEAERNHILPQYIEEQTKLKHTKTNKQREEIEKKRKNSIQIANEEADGFLWLLDHNINIDNVIYYSHSRTFGFGWCGGISPEVKNELDHLLGKFPFKFEYELNNEYETRGQSPAGELDHKIRKPHG